MKTINGEARTGIGLPSSRFVSIAKIKSIQLVVALILTGLLATQVGGLFDRSAGAETVNLVQNGSFEQPVVTNPQNWDLFTVEEVPHWNLAFGDRIEIMRQNGWFAFAGLQFVELDSIGDASSIYQDIDTRPGTVYFLQFAFSPRPDEGIPAANPAEDNRMDVFWGPTGGLPTFQEHFHTDGTGVTQTQWTHYSRPVTATSSSTRIEFQYAGPVTTYGALLDDV